MSDKKHTPGPWSVIEDRTNSFKPERPWREIRAGRTKVVGCSGYTRHRGDESEEHYGVVINEADARLIAAAPEMLAELKTQSDFYKNCMTASMTRRDYAKVEAYGDIVKRIDALIKKATIA